MLVPRLCAALEKLNPTLPPEAIAAAIDELTRDRSAMLLEQANREVYRLLKEGIPVSVPDQLRGGQRAERVRVIDWEQPANNDFLLVSQFSVTGALYTCRPDLVGFVNGLPLVVIELKKPGVPARAAFDENLTSYKHPQNGIPALFVFNALLIASNGTDSRVGSLTADWERFFEWKRIEREDEPRRVSLEVMIRGTCDKARLLDLVENFTLFSEHKAGLVKIIGQNHQFLGVNNAIASMLEARKRGDGRGGVFWQTQGSGKSFSMVFFAQKVLRNTYLLLALTMAYAARISKSRAAAAANRIAALGYAMPGAVIAIGKDNDAVGWGQFELTKVNIFNTGAVYLEAGKYYWRVKSGDAWQRTLDLNLMGVFRTTQAVARQMIAQGHGGRIVNGSSGAGRRGNARIGAYAASKFGVIIKSGAAFERFGVIRHVATRHEHA